MQYDIELTLVHAVENTDDQASMSSCINNWYNKDPIERRQQTAEIESQ